LPHLFRRVNLFFFGLEKNQQGTLEAKVSRGFPMSKQGLGCGGAIVVLLGLGLAVQAFNACSRAFNGSPSVVNSAIVTPTPLPPVASVSPSPAPRTSMLYEVTGNSIFAESEAALDEAVKYVAQGDKEAFGKLMVANVIFQLKPGTQVYLEKCVGFTCSMVKVRLAGETTTLYALREAIKEVK
jgi:hypothetical protein